MDGTHWTASSMYCGQLPGVYGTHVDVIAKEFLYIISKPTPIYMRVQLSLKENEYLAARCVPRTADDASHSGVAGFEPSFLATGAKERNISSLLVVNPPISMQLFEGGQRLNLLCCPIGVSDCI